MGVGIGVGFGLAHLDRELRHVFQEHGLEPDAKHQAPVGQPVVQGWLWLGLGLGLGLGFGFGFGFGWSTLTLTLPLSLPLALAIALKWAGVASSSCWK